MIYVCHRWPNIWVGWIKINFSIIGQKQNQMLDTMRQMKSLIVVLKIKILIWKKRAVLVFRRNFKVGYDLTSCFGTMGPDQLRDALT